MPENLEVKYGLPSEVIFCKRCVLPNQRPTSTIEFQHKPNHQHKTLHIDEEGICDGCRYAEQKELIDWERREQDLVVLLDKHRLEDGRFDCIVPGSGGKDSAYAAHILKYKYGMHPLTVTWPPLIYTEVGWTNFLNWLNVGGFPNVTFRPNGKVHALLTKLATENLLHPFQSFILGQKNLPPKVALEYGVPLVFYGESGAEYGNPIADNATSLHDSSNYTLSNLDQVHIGGVSTSELKEVHNLSLNDLSPYLPGDPDQFAKSQIEVHYLGYYLKWTPQEAYYYAVENMGFEASPVRTEGTYNKYNSIDDRSDGFFHYTAYIKFGYGRATFDAAQEIRNRHITREEGVALIQRFDGEFPKRYFEEVMDHIGLKPERFLELCDEFRSPHLWKRENGDWELRKQVS